MPYKAGKLKGELTVPELRRLVEKHNELLTLKIPAGTDRDGILALIKKNGYDVDHAKQKLIPRVKMKRKPVVPLPAVKPRAPARKPRAKPRAGQPIETQTENDPEFVRMGFMGPMGQIGTGGGGTWTIDDEAGMLTG